MTHSTASHPRRRAAVARRIPLAIVILGAACGGPRAPLDIGAKTVPLDLVLGAKKAVAGAPVPPAAFAVDDFGAPRFFFTQELPASSPPPSSRRPRPAAPTGCIDDPLAVPKLPAAPNTILPPRATTYTYRAAGKVREGTAETKLPELAEVQVLNTNWEILLQQMTWQTAVSFGDATTTTSYRARNPSVAGILVQEQQRQLAEKLAEDEHVRQLNENEYFRQIPLGGLVTVELEPAAPERPDEEPYWPQAEDPFTSIPALRGRVQNLVPPAYPASGVIDGTAQPIRGLHPGLYMEKVERNDGTKFEPPPPGMLLAKFPMEPGSTFDVAGTDGVTTMVYRTTVKPRETVFACGTAISAWPVELSRGRLIDVKTGQTVEFSARYMVATQYGGLIVADSTHVKGTVVGAQGPVEIERTIETSTMTAPLF